MKETEDKGIEDKGIGRAFKLFEYFEEMRRPIGVVEACEALGFPRSSTAAMFATLVKLGYLAHDRASRSYLPTAKVSDLGRWTDALLFGEERTLLTQLTVRVGRETVETVVLGIRDELEARYVHVELPERPVLYLVKAGSLRPLPRSAVGWALMSAMEDTEIARIVARWNGLPARSGSPVDHEQVIAEVEHTRARGYAFSKHSFVKDIGMIAMLLPPRPGLRRMALGVGGPVDRLEAREADIVRSMVAASVAFEAPAAQSALADTSS